MSLTAIDGQPPLPMMLYDLATCGYEQQEFVLDGVAQSFTLIGDRGADGRWQAIVDDTAPFTTRLVVRRPVKPAHRSGVTLVEWLNVTSGMDLAPDWSVLHREIMRAGHVWVGVSAQRAGIDGGGILFEGMPLKRMNPDRYASLAHPGDAFAFDIFTQAGQAVRGATDAEHLLAIGESQSAIFLTTYVNAIAPLGRVFDGFLVHSRGAGGVAIDGQMPTFGADGVASPIRALPGEAIRSDAPAPVFVLQTETDVALLGSCKHQQEDGHGVRLWEIAGAAHGDMYLLTAGELDSGTMTPAALAAATRPTTQLPWGAIPLPSNPGLHHHYVAQAALRWLVTWACGGESPPKAARLQLTADRQGFVVDDSGLACGGVRTPWVDAPTMVLSGVGQPDPAAELFGSSAPLDTALLRHLYPGGLDDYLAKFAAHMDVAMSAGFILTDDRDEILAVAAAAASELFETSQPPK